MRSSNNAHFSEMPARPPNVCLWGKSGKHRLSLSIAPLDPLRTSIAASSLQISIKQLRCAFKLWGVEMIRRDFLGALFCLPAALPFATDVQAQDVGRKYRIAALVPQTRNSSPYIALFGEIQKFGFVEGQNLTIDFRSYGQQIELL